MGQGRHHTRALAAQEALADAGRSHRGPLLAVVLRSVARTLKGDRVVGGTVRGAAFVVGRRRLSPGPSAAVAITSATASAPMLEAVSHASPRSHSCIAIIVRLTPSLHGLACRGCPRALLFAATHYELICRCTFSLQVFFPNFFESVRVEHALSGALMRGAGHSWQCITPAAQQRVRVHLYSSSDSVPGAVEIVGQPLFPPPPPGLKLLFGITYLEPRTKALG